MERGCALRTRILLCTAVSVTVMSLGATQATSALELRVKELMSPAEFRAAGLVKLTTQELASLDRWLNQYTETVITVATSQDASPERSASAKRATVPPSPAVIETCIEGDFSGWEGETIFKLCNGQIWQQAEYDYMYSYSYRPDVVIYRTSAGYRMKVEDEEETILVVRLR